VGALGDMSACTPEGIIHARRNTTPLRTTMGSSDLFARRRRAPCLASLDDRSTRFDELPELPSLALSRKARNAIPDAVGGPLASQAGETQSPDSVRSRGFRTPTGRTLRGCGSSPVILAAPQGNSRVPNNFYAAADAFGATPSSASSAGKGFKTTPGKPGSRGSLGTTSSTPTLRVSSGVKLEPAFPPIGQCEKPPSRSRVARHLDVEARLCCGGTAADFPPTPSTAMASAATPSSACASTPSSRGVATPAESVRIHDWRQGRQIGAGSFGSVYKAQDTTTGQIFAVKVAKIRDGEDRKHFETLQRELEICKDLRHRHIVSYLGHEYQSKNHSLFIYLEYVAGGSLRTMLKEFGPLQGELLCKATRGILKGLSYLHTHSPPVVHRDLKGSNVLIDLNFCAKLADFGCSKCDMNTQTFTTYGSILWMAPEVLQGSGYGRLADIWSFACVVVEMFTAGEPWGAKAFDNPMQAMYTIAASEKTPRIPENISDAGRDLLAICFRRNPCERPSATELLKHELVQDAFRTSRCPVARGT